MTTILTSPWPKSLSEFVVACLSWDPKRRPTSTQCLNHEYFREVERYLPIRDHLPSIACRNWVLTVAPPASMHTTSQNTKGLGIEIPQPPRGARQQPSYSPLPQQYSQPELTHHQSQPQLQQQVSYSVSRLTSRQKEDGFEDEIRNEILQYQDCPLTHPNSLKSISHHHYLPSLQKLSHRVLSTVEWRFHHPLNQLDLNQRRTHLERMKC